MMSKSRNFLTEVGLEELPADDDAELNDYGFDSLMIVLLVVEIEKDLGIRVPGALATKENFQTISTIAHLVKKLGAT